MAFLLGLTSCAEVGQTEPIPSSVSPKIEAALLRERNPSKFLPVIVRLNVPELQFEKSEVARAAAIVAATDAVVAKVGPDKLRIVHRFTIVPGFSAWANSDALRNLASLTEVIEVVLDRRERAQLDKSTRLIEADRVWTVSTGRDRFVAILDTGIDRHHPFVRGRVTHEACFRRDSRCPNGRQSQVGTGAAQNMNASHGMHVAGIAAGAAGQHGSLQLSGVAPGANIVAINVFSGNGSYVGDQVKALEHVAGLRRSGVLIAAANLSIGGGKHFESCDVTQKSRAEVIMALLEISVATVVAAGNSGHSNAVTSPGCITSAITVSSLNDDDTLHTGDNRSKLTDLLAPGRTILSSVPDDVYNGSAADDYSRKSGTSMATPHVTGAFALLSAAAPNATATDILQALIETGRTKVDPVTGRNYRRIDLDDALHRLTGGR
jgi:subtilisin family serine protease